MSAIEDRLRDALAGIAATTMPPPDAWQRQRRRQARDRSRRLGLGAAAAVALVASGVALAGPWDQRITPAAPASPPRPAAETTTQPDANLVGAPDRVAIVTTDHWFDTPSNPRGTTAGPSTDTGREITAVAAFGDGTRFLYASAKPGECDGRVVDAMEENGASTIHQTSFPRELPGRVTSMSVSPDGQSVAVAIATEARADGTCGGGRLLVRDLRAKQDRVWDAGDATLTSLSFGPSGRVAYELQVCCGERATVVHVLDQAIAGNDLLQASIDISAEQAALMAPAFGPDGTLVVARQRYDSGKVDLVRADLVTRTAVGQLSISLPGVPARLDYDRTGNHLVAVIDDELWRWDRGPVVRFGEVEALDAQW